MALSLRDFRDRLEQSQIYACTAALRTLPWESRALNSARSVKMAADDATHPANSFVLGKNPLNGKRVWQQTEKFEHASALNKVFTVLSGVMRERHPQFEFHQITINKNLKCKKHRDSHNKGESYIVGFGDYRGGELTLWPEDNSSTGEWEEHVSGKQQAHLPGADNARRQDLALASFSLSCEGDAIEIDEDVATSLYQYTPLPPLTIASPHFIT
jgi:hypothetical protein